MARGSPVRAPRANCNVIINPTSSPRVHLHLNPSRFWSRPGFFTRDSGLLRRGFQALGIEIRAVMPGDWTDEDGVNSKQESTLPNIEAKYLIRRSLVGHYEDVGRASIHGTENPFLIFRCAKYRDPRTFIACLIGC